MQFYKDIFSENGEQCVQMFVATHSQYVIESALRDSRNTLIINVKDGKHITNKNVLLDSMTFGEVNYLIFVIYSIDYHIFLYDHLHRFYIDKKNGGNYIAIQEFDKIYLSKIKEIQDELKSNNLSFDDSSDWSKYQGNLLKIGANDKTGKIVRETLPTFIRNAIDHPQHNKATQISYDDLSKSTELLINAIKSFK